MKRLSLAGWAIVGASALACGPADAAFLDIATQTPEGVIFAGIGTVNTAGLKSAGNGSIQLGLTPGLGVLTLDQSVADLYTNFSGPMSFGTGGPSFPTTQAGDIFGIAAFQNLIVLPSGYVSGTNLSSVATFTRATFASLGLTPGSYVYTFGSGATADSIALQIGAVASAVPEPASLALLGMGVAGIAAVGRRRTA